MIHEHDRVVLTAPLCEEGLEPGDIGAVVHVYPRNEAYEVEFVTLTGKSAAVVTVPATQVRPVGSHEIPHARELVNERFGLARPVSSLVVPEAKLPAAYRPEFLIDTRAEAAPLQSLEK